jgi:hypothetical protein
MADAESEEEEISRLLEIRKDTMFADLIVILEAVSGHKDFAEDGAVVPRRTEADILVNVDSVVAEMQGVYLPKTPPVAVDRPQYKRFFEYYDALVYMLDIRRHVLTRFCRRRNQAEADEWLEFFLLKFDRLIEEVRAYRDRLIHLVVAHVSRDTMCSALFEFLVCLFLGPGQIEKLKEIVNASMHPALDAISDMYGKDTQGNHQYLLGELSTDDDHFLKTAVYMAHVDMDITGWKQIYYGDCLSLLKFAKGEIGDIDTQIHALQESWQRFLGTLTDIQGQVLQPCVLCDRNIRDVIYMPCRHLVACRACATAWRVKSRACPFCRGTVTSMDSVRQHRDAGTTRIPFTQNAQLPLSDIPGLLTQLRCVGLTE